MLDYVELAPYRAQSGHITLLMGAARATLNNSPLFKGNVSTAAKTKTSNPMKLYKAHENPNKLIGKMNRVQTDPRPFLACLKRRTIWLSYIFLPFLPFVILLASESLKCGSTGKSAIREPDSVALGAPWCAAVNSRSRP